MRAWVAGTDIDSHLVKVIGEGVLQHGRALSESKGGQAQPVACLVMENDLLIGGATGRTEFRRLFINYLWIDAQWRGKGLGAEALHRLEASAAKTGCVDALIETLDDEVAKWYARCGYELIGHIPGYCGPWSRHTLLKSLAE
ncbi:GNAT family N-acetyltransferase [Pseudomonas syringae]|uniref:GNAT family N-acetyltransferase n=1 Tax=Pseudomonas syringae TaxID=317 RepID=UPI003F85637B